MTNLEYTFKFTLQPLQTEILLGFLIKMYSGASAAKAVALTGRDLSTFPPRCPPVPDYFPEFTGPLTRELIVTDLPIKHFNFISLIPITTATMWLHGESFASIALKAVY